VKLRELREGDRGWRIVVVNGPNLSRLRIGDPELETIEDLATLVTGWGAELDVEVEHFASNHEGRILEYLHSSAERTDGYLVNPGGLIRVGESLRHALKETQRPVVEVHLQNVTKLGGESILTPGVIGICSGFHQYSYLAALVALVRALDDPSFLHPESESDTNRAHGVPRSLFE